MKSKQIMFFTQLEDIENIIRDFESSIEIQYYKTGLLDSRVMPTYNSLFNAPNVGFTSSGDWNKIDSYLISKKSTPLNIREVPQRTGEMRIAVDQMNNPKSIELKIGGIYEEKENVIVAGRIATISEDSDSLELFKLLSTKIKNEFKKIGAFYVGKSAEEKLKKGWRLVTNEKLPKEFDLVLS
jgi:type II secretory pathway component HofQ